LGGGVEALFDVTAYPREKVNREELTLSEDGLAIEMGRYEKLSEPQVIQYRGKVITLEGTGEEE